MLDYLINVIAFFLLVPFLGYLLIFLMVKAVTKNHRRSVNLALDFSTLLFILSVHFLVMTIWQESILWLALLIICGVGIVFVFLNWKSKGEIDYLRVFKGMWRFSFLLFSFAYIILMLVGIIMRAITFAEIL